MSSGAGGGWCSASAYGSWRLQPRFENGHTRFPASDPPHTPPVCEVLF